LRASSQNHILQHRTKANGAEDLRLFFLGQIDALRIAAAFKIENTGGAPAVLVVADQPPRRVGRERRLAGAR